MIKAVTVLFGLMIIAAGMKVGLIEKNWDAAGSIVLFGSWLVIYGLRDVPAVRRRFPDLFQRVGKKRSSNS